MNTTTLAILTLILISSWPWVTCHAGDRMSAQKSRGVQYLEELQKKEMDGFDDLGVTHRQEIILRAFREILNRKNLLLTPEGLSRVRLDVMNAISASKGLELKVLQVQDAWLRTWEALLKRNPYAREPSVHKAIVEPWLNELAKISDTALPTKFEDPLRYSQTMEKARQIEDSAKDFSVVLPFRPLIGTLSIGPVNAITMRVCPSDQYLVIFQREIFNFALLLSKVVVRAMPMTPSNEGGWSLSVADTGWQKNIDENQDIMERFKEVIFAYLFDGSPGDARPYVPEAQYSLAAKILIESMELFIMGHEYGHITAKHVDACQKEADFQNMKEPKELVRSKQNELEADAIGLRFAVHAMQKQGLDLAMSAWGADFFFSCQDIVERGISIMRTGDKNNRPRSTHPPTWERREKIRETLRHYFQSDAAEAAVDLGMTLQRVMEYLWDRTESVLKNYHKGGRKLARIWE